MKFKHWLNTNEMATFSMRSAHLTVPCGKVFAGSHGIHMPCIEKPVGAIDMRFEDYPPPYNRKFGNGTKFAALIPSSDEYLIYHGQMMKEPEVLLGSEATKQGYLPVNPTTNQVDRTPGTTSQGGYVLIPDDWFIYAQIFDADYELIKPALTDANGKRMAQKYGT